MNRLVSALATAIVFACSPVSAQSIFRFTEENTSTTVRSSYFYSVRDLAGREWYASNNKIDCKDGIKWRQYNIDSMSYVSYIKTTPDTSLWVCSNKSVYRIDKQGTLTPFYNTVFEPGNTLSLFCENSNNIAVFPTYYGSEYPHKKIFRFRNNAFVDTLLTDGQCLHQEPNGTLWYQTQSALYEIRPDTLLEYSIPYASNFVFGVRTNNNEVWMSNQNLRIQIVNGNCTVHANIEEYTFNNFSHNIVEGTDGSIWTHLAPHLIGRFKDNVWTIYTPPHDPETGIMTMNDSVFYVSDSKIRMLHDGTEYEVPPPFSDFEKIKSTVDWKHNSFLYLHKDILYKLTPTLSWEIQQASVYTSHNKGTFTLPGNYQNNHYTISHYIHQMQYVYDGTSWNLLPYSVPNGLRNNYIFCMAEDLASNNWIATYTGISILANESAWHQMEYSHEVKKDFYVYDIAVLDDNNVFLATNQGLHWHNGTEWKIYNNTIAGVDETVYEVLLDKKSNIWLSTNQGNKRANYSGESLMFTRYDENYVNDNMNTFFALNSTDHFHKLKFITNSAVILKVFKNNSWYEYNIGFDDPMPSISSYDLVIDKEDSIWLKIAASENNMFALYKLRGNKFYAQSKIGGNKSRVCIDKNNNRWLWNNNSRQLQSDNQSIFLENNNLRPAMYITSNNTLWMQSSSFVSGLFRIRLSELGVAINDPIENAESVMLYPVPAGNEITIDMELTNALVTITNSLGQTMSGISIHGNVLDISSLSAGIYHIRIETEKGYWVKSFCKM